MLDYSLLFVMQFCCGGNQSAQDYAGLSWGWKGKSHMVHGDNLFVLPTDTQAGLELVFVAGVREMVPNFLSIMLHGEAFHRLGVQDVESLILVGALFLL
jgi:hypothetical protein